MRVTVVGSGASGVHFALSLLRKGYKVLMVDVGNPRPAPANPQDDFTALKERLDDPVRYFLGENYESLILPGHDGEYYGFPPSKNYVFERPAEFRYSARGFSPLVSFAAGGLAEAWTGGCYPFNNEELAAFPFGFREIRPYYEEVARRIGITGAEDDLAAFLPLHDGLMAPLDLDEHSEVLLAAYRRRKSLLNGLLRCYVGRSRIATLSRDLGERKACNYSGRCLWGCPRESLYTPSVTLSECRRHAGFEYLDGLYATHFRYSLGGRIDRLTAVSKETGLSREMEVEALALAAGTLSSSKIVLRSIYEDCGQVVSLRGLMDNRQVLMPFVNLKMIGKRYRPDSYQYHQLAVGMEGAGAMDYIHGLVTTLKTALIHPIVQSLPLDLGGAASMFRNLHAALGLVNINFSDARRDENCLTLETDSGGGPRLAIQYRPDPGEATRIREAKKRFQRVLWKLGCVAPSAMAHTRPMGASVHYAGTIPMTRTGGALTATEQCRSRDFSNLYLVDGTTFPALPAKNLTFTLMANAARVAAEAF